MNAEDLSQNSFVVEHVVSIGETNYLGGVYYARVIEWQGRCRERFLVEKAPALLPSLGKTVFLATLRCECDFLGEVHAFDSVRTRLQLLRLRPSRMTLKFESWRDSLEGCTLVARGQQEIRCLVRDGDGQLVPGHFPFSLTTALRPYLPAVHVDLPTQVASRTNEQESLS